MAQAYEYMDKKGVKFYLQNLQKLKDGPHLSSRKKAEDVFDALEDADESNGADVDSDNDSNDDDDSDGGF